MVPLIEEQIQKVLTEKEEERCLALEVKFDKNPKTKGKKVTRKPIPKWTRPAAFALCQDLDLLRMVGQFDYDLSDEMFEGYCSRRGVIHVTGEPGSRRWQYMANCRKSKTDYLSDPYFHFAEEVDGRQHRFTEQEMHTGWEIMLLGRARLQDCWQLYQREAKSASDE